MLDLQEIRERLKDRKLTVVAEATGVSRATLYRVAAGDTGASYDTAKTLSDYLLGEGRFAQRKEGQK